jgi:FMN phosphatase YigB (HAD superfamily)
LSLLKFFDGTSFSDEVGVYKPSRVIFDHALRYLDCAASEVVHIGDLQLTDIDGAVNAGFQAVRFRGCYDDPAAAADVGVVDSWDQLVASW